MSERIGHPSNAELARVFQTIADYLALEGDSTYRILAYERAAQLFRSHPLSIASLAERGELRQLPGVGQAIEAKVLELISTGHIAVLDRFRTRYPEDLLQVMRLPGIGPKTARRLWESLEVGNIEELTRALREGRLRQVSGMGEKTEARILQAINAWTAAPPADSETPRLLLAEVQPQAEQLLTELRRLPGVVAADLAGSVRRGRETVRDIDLVTASNDASTVMDRFGLLPELAGIDQRGETKLTAVTHSGLAVDLRAVAPTSYGNLLQHSTGSAAHNVALRGYAQRKGYKVCEYDIEQIETGRKITCPLEPCVYETLGLAYIPPELREGQNEIEEAEANRLPTLIELDDVRGDLHVHSDWTDGKASLEDMACAARAIGLDYLCFCDHSRALAMTGGLGPERLLEQVETIRALDARLEGIKILAGIEVDILLDGRLDLPDAVLSRLDFVTASIHSGSRQSSSEITERIIRAMRNPHVRSIAHPTGRLLNRRESYSVDLEILAGISAETGTFLEINGSPDRLDLSGMAARRAVSLGATIVISSDAHRTREFDNLRAGVKEARRGWVTPAQVANCRPWPEVLSGRRA